MATRTYIGKATNPSTGGTTQSYPGQGIGTAAADRTVVVVVNGTTQGALSSLTATLAGNSMNSEILVNGPADSGVNNSFVAILSLAVSSGTTATIALTASRSCFDINILVYAVYGNIGGTKVTNSGTLSNTGTINLNSNTVASGIVIAGSHGYFYNTPPSSNAPTWTGVTRDDNFTNYTEDYCDSASLEVSSTETPRTISLAATMNRSGSSVCAAVVSYSPSATGGGPLVEGGPIINGSLIRGGRIAA